MVKGASEGLYHQRLAQFFGDCLSLEIHTDASAARGVLVRSAVGKLKHLSTKQLWLQEFVARGEVKIVKIPRDKNIADALTHPFLKADIKVFHEMGFQTQPDNAT